MDGYFTNDREELEPRIHAMLADQALPPWVTGHDIAFGASPVDNEPAIWIGLQVPLGLKVDQDLARQYTDMVIQLQQSLSGLAPGYHSHVRLVAQPAAAA